MTDTINNQIPFVPENTIDPAAGLNLSINTIDALLQVLVQTVGANTPPAGVEGQRHIVGTSPTGAWAGQANKLARFLGGAWQFFDARYALNVADGLWYVRSSSAWLPISGNVAGPVSAVDGGVALFDGVTGKIIKDGGALGSAAFTPSTAYATSSQGATADSALQPGAIGVTVQGYSANLAAFSGLSGLADRLPYFTGAGALSLTTLTGLARNLLDDTTQSEMQSTLGLVKQTSATDTTAGALMAVGAFGVGSHAPQITVSDLNSLVVVGRWRDDGYADVLNRPAGFYYGEIVVGGYMAGFETQTYTSANGRRAFRTRTDWVWGAWREQYHTGNLLGTVSQSGGVPTGSIIERGSNANGEYVRFADGTQICTNSNNAIATNPATFTGTVTDIDGSKFRVGRWY